MGWFLGEGFDHVDDDFALLETLGGIVDGDSVAVLDGDRSGEGWTIDLCVDR